jgi:hypothetical protein
MNWVRVIGISFVIIGIGHQYHWEPLISGLVVFGLVLVVNSAVDELKESHDHTS